MTSSDLTLYGNSASGNCLKPKFVADYTGLDYEWVEVDILSGETRTEAFRQLNPLGKLPFARWADGRFLPESNAIMLHLAELHGANTLIPADLFTRAQMISWLFWEQYSHEPYIAVRRFKKHFLQLPDEDIDSDLAERGNAALDLMEQQLSYTDYLVGSSLTLADIGLFAYTRWADEGGFDLSSRPGITAWLSRIGSELGVK